MLRTVFPLCLVAALSLADAGAQDAGARIVFQNGRSVPVAAVVVQGNQIIVKAAAEGLGRDDKQDLALRLMRDAGVSQRQASDITGVSRDTIRKHEQKIGA